MTNRLLYLYFERQREIFLDVEIHGRLKLNHYLIRQTLTIFGKFAPSSPSRLLINSECFEYFSMNGKSQTISNSRPFVLSPAEGLREDFSATC